MVAAAPPQLAMGAAELPPVPGKLADAAARKQPAAAEDILHFSWGQRQQAKECLATLVEALKDDVVNGYFTSPQPASSRRRRFVKDEVKGYLKALPAATNFIATPDRLAVALWQLLPLETPRNELWAGWTRILKVPPRLWAQLFRLELKYESAHKEVAAAVGPYYYLSFIGTRTEARGRGLGSRLLKHITDRADTEGRWCLLEATSELSQTLYARHGFVTYEAYRVSPAAPPVFLMKRPPAAAAAAPPAAAAAASAAPVVAAISLAGSSPGGATKAGLAEAVAAKISAAAGRPLALCAGGGCSLGGAPASPLIAAAPALGSEDGGSCLYRLRLGGGSSSGASSSGGEDSGEDEPGMACVVPGSAVAPRGLPDAAVLIRSPSALSAASDTRAAKTAAEAGASAAAVAEPASAASCVACGSNSIPTAGGARAMPAAPGSA